MSHPTLPAPAALLASSLTSWFRAHARALPWREERTPYRVWLSEVMLQQTRVATVVGYFERFLARFPDVEALAAAEEDEVLALWSGLGYYARGRNLHRAAKAVVVEHGGVFPASVDGLDALPGVGPYTAAAIGSLAFGLPAAVVDGNVLRVLSRLCDDDTPAGSDVAAARAQALVDVSGDAATVNEGLMELGALVCTPRGPSCGGCPWASACLAFARGTVDERPVKAKRRARRRLRVACAVLHDGDHVWLERRASRGLFGGLYEPPARAVDDDVATGAAIRGLLEERSVVVPRRLPPALRVERVLTHRELILDVVPLALARDVRAQAAPWFRGDDLCGVGISSAVRAVLEVAWPNASRFLGAERRRA